MTINEPEARTRAGKGYTVLYVGHEGHDEAVGTLAEAPELIRLVEHPEDLETVADGQLSSGEWQIRHAEDGVEVKGPQDEHAKLNVNTVPRNTLLELDGMTMDVADAIIDWRDTDDNPGMMGAEYDF